MNHSRELSTLVEVRGRSLTRRGSGASLFVMALACSNAPIDVHAQDAASAIEEVVVSAQRREENLQDVPISISVLSGDDLDNARVQGLTEALNRVSGVAVPIGALGAPQVVIRGVTSGGLLLTGSTTAAYYLDGVPYGFVRSAIVPDADVYDLQRIEVLRGPQGTLFGANAQSGVVRILTHPADLGEFGIKARGAFSTTEGGGNNARADVVVNAPIIEDRLAARVVYGRQDLSGWIDKPTRKDANDVDIENIRIRLDARPTDRLSVSLSSWSNDYAAGAQAIGDDNGNNSARDVEPVDTRTEARSFRVSYDFDRFSLVSTTSDLEFSIASDLDLGVLGLPIIQSALFASEVFSQELTASSSGEGSWRWSIGAGFRDVEDRFVRKFSGTSVGDYEDQSTSNAVFGELTRVMSPDLELTVGLRYFEDEVETRENISSSGVPGTPLVDSAAKFDSFTPRVVLTYLPGGDLTIYASYSRGFRSGMPQNPEVIARAPGFPPVGSDLLTNYELGTKGAALDGRLGFEAAVFFLDWQDVQQNLNRTFGGINLNALVNGASASGMGIEFGMSARPISGLNIGLNFSWNDLTFDDDVISGEDVLFRSGERLLSSPEFIVGTSFDYAFSLGEGLRGVLAASANYISEQENNTLAPSGAAAGLDSDDLFTSRASFAIESDHWVTTLFVENLSNEDGASVRFIGVPDWSGRNTRPRTIGLQLEYTF